MLPPVSMRARASTFQPRATVREQRDNKIFVFVHLNIYIHMACSPRGEFRDGKSFWKSREFLVVAALCFSARA